jgi:serine/threonine protein kinase
LLPTGCRVAQETIGIIEALHARGTVHCDIKPENVLLNQVSVAGFVLVNMWHERDNQLLFAYECVCRARITVWDS